MKKSVCRVCFDGSMDIICPYCKSEHWIGYIQFEKGRCRCIDCKRTYRSPFYERNKDKDLNRGHKRFSLFNFYIKLRRRFIRIINNSEAL